MSTTVGIFDSGVGGLTVAGELHRLLPALPLRYIADTACFPYGNRTEAAVRERALALAGRLVDGGCSLLVVACNTASSAALERLRATIPVPVVGMEPPLKPAVERSRSGRVAVLVTSATARGARLARLHDSHANGAEVETVPAPGLADLVESGEIAGERVERLLRSVLAAPLRRGVDQIALGCTHYGFLRPVLERIVGDAVQVVDAAEPVARRARQQLEEHRLTVPGGARVPGENSEQAGEQTVVCSVTGDAAAFEAALTRLRAAGAPLPPTLVLREPAVPAADR